MKYAKDTLKYFKGNPLLLPCFLIAAACAALLVDVSAYQTIANSIDGGRISDSFCAWFNFFVLFNPQNALSIILGVVAYIVLILDLTLIQSLIDNHVRFGSRSLKSVASGFNINIVNGLMFSVFTIIIHLLSGVVMAAIMKTCELIPVAYSYVIGIIVIAILAIFILFVCSLFLLWLPCVEITGFKKYEALAYSYALARQRIWKIFFSFAVPVFIIVGASVAIGMLCIPVVTYTVVPLLIGALLVYTSVLSYMAYVDAEGIEREDIKKF
jgi:hypothetical protein